jgi:hypothetical protein
MTAIWRHGVSEFVAKGDRSSVPAGHEAEVRLVAR